MGLLVAFGDDANFVLAVGGFHPRFKPPPLPFPSPRGSPSTSSTPRCARIRVEGYFAVTTNTVQFGARPRSSSASIASTSPGTSPSTRCSSSRRSTSSSDSPRTSRSRCSASACSAFGSGSSSKGPTPWRARGGGHLAAVLRHRRRLRRHLGRAARHHAAADRGHAAAGGGVDKVENWRPCRRPAPACWSRCARCPRPRALVVLHPLGALQISQRRARSTSSSTGSASRSRRRQRGSRSAAASTDVRQAAATSTSGSRRRSSRTSPTTSKLSPQAFEPQHGGVELSAAGAQLASGAAIDRVVRYELITIDTNCPAPRAPRSRPCASALFNHFLAGRGRRAARRSVGRSTKLRVPLPTE